MRILTIALILGLLGCAGSVARAGDVAAECTDHSAVTWVLPGQFEDAQKKSASEKRLLLIKGIAFGVDELGAKDARKGCW